MNWTKKGFFALTQDDKTGKGQQPILALAPLADHTDSPFCNVCRKVFDKKSVIRKILNQVQDDKMGFVIFREMVSAEAIVRGSEKTLKMCKFKRKERPIVIQIFGGKPKVMVEAVKIIVKKFKPDGIDINMGCPVSKIARKGESGAALMKDQDRACEIIREVKKVLDNQKKSYLLRYRSRYFNKQIPLSVKTRLGWSNSEDILDFAPKLEKAGADLITIHGRTKMQGYSGKADWEMIGRVKEKVNIPIIANGDITLENFKECLKITGADGLMIGRGALGNPWVFKEIAASQAPRNDKCVSLKERVRAILYHAKLHQKRYGTLVSFRKHLMWYFKGTRVQILELKKLRMQLVKIETLKDLKKILKKIHS